jgi:putative transposase
MKSTIPMRRSIRLRDYDYGSEGLYFVTICTNDRLCMFGQIVESKMRSNDAGKIIDEAWSTMFRFFDDGISWIVMPNHLHGIIAIDPQANKTSSRKLLGRLVGGFKTITTKRVNEIRATPGAILWQRGFYEHIIRDDRSFANIVAYIEDNPSRWGADPENRNFAESRERETPRIR